MIAMLGGLPCLASTSLLIRLTDGTDIICSLDKEPQMVFGEKMITLSSLEGAIGEWNFTDVESWRFADVEEPSVIDGTKGEKAQIRIEKGMITVVGKKSKDVALYDMNGRLKTPSCTTSGNKTSLTLGGLAKGTYLLKVDNSCVKFNVK